MQKIVNNIIKQNTKKNLLKFLVCFIFVFIIFLINTKQTYAQAPTNYGINYGWGSFASTLSKEDQIKWAKATENGNWFKVAWKGWSEFITKSNDPVSRTFRKAGELSTLDFDILAGKITSGILKGLGSLISEATKALIEFIFIPMANSIVTLSGKLLNYSVQYTIYESLSPPTDEDGVSSSANPISLFDDSIKQIWTIIRDLFNICFIFMLLYVAIRKILGMAGGKIQAMLFSIIISAIFINFSFFTSRIIIDIGNTITATVYNQIEGEADKLTVGTETSSQTEMKEINGKGSTIKISEILRDSLALQTIYNGDQTISSYNNKTLGQSLFRLIIYVVTGFVFFSLTFLLISRYVALIFLIAASPVGFLFGSIPGMDKYSKKWWDELIKQVAIAPIFMFFMLIIIRVGQTSGLVSMRTNDANSDVGSYLNYAVIISLMIASIKITKSLGGSIGGFSEKVASFATGAALATVTGGTALLGRQIIGRGAASLAGSGAGKWLQEKGAKGGIIGGLSNLTLKGIKGTANSTFDVRNSKTAQEAFGQMKSISGGAVDIQGALNSVGSYGKAGGDYGKDKKGFTGWKDKRNEEVLKVAQGYDKAAKDQEAKLNLEAQEKNGVQQKILIEKRAKEAYDRAENDLATSTAANQASMTTRRDAALADYNAKKAERMDAERNTGAGINNKAEEKFTSGAVSSADSETKRAYEQAQARISAIRVDQATNRHEQERGRKTKEDYDREEAELQKQLKEATEDMETARLKGIQEQVEAVEKEILSSNNPNDKKVIDLIKKRQLRKDYVKSIKDQFFTFYTTNEKNSIAKTASGSKGESKEKSEEEKTLAALLSQIEKLNNKK